MRVLTYDVYGGGDDGGVEGGRVRGHLTVVLAAERRCDGLQEQLRLIGLLLLNEKRPLLVTIKENNSLTGFSRQLFVRQTKGKSKIENVYDFGQRFVQQFSIMQFVLPKLVIRSHHKFFFIF